jgi:hypothetical protein
MGYERYPRGDYYGRREHQDEQRNYGADRETDVSSRDYLTAGAQDRDHDYWGGEFDSDRDGGGFGRRDYGYRGMGGGRGYGARDYGPREYGHEGYARRERPTGGFGGGYRGARQGQWQGGGDYGRGGYQGEDRGFGRDRFQGGGGYGPRGDRFGGRGGYGSGERQRDGADRQVPRDYDYDDRGFFARAGDEVRSWFGDEEAERRREADMRYDERAYADRDSDYHSWRRNQIDALDRDYNEYRSENRSKFEREFSTWRTGRQAQRDALTKVEEHMDVVGSDGAHVGTVDKVLGDRILLTKSDADAGGHHHSIPSRWIETVDTKVTLSKTADEAKSHWRDEERNQAMFGDEPRSTGNAGTSGRDSRTGTSDDGDAQGRMLNRSFPGTY